VAGIISESNGAMGNRQDRRWRCWKASAEDGLDIWTSRGGGAAGGNHDCLIHAVSGEIGIFQMIDVHLFGVAP